MSDSPGRRTPFTLHAGAKADRTPLVIPWCLDCDSSHARDEPILFTGGTHKDQGRIKEGSKDADMRHFRDCQINASWAQYPDTRESKTLNVLSPLDTTNYRGARSRF